MPDAIGPLGLICEPLHVVPDDLDSIREGAHRRFAAEGGLVIVGIALSLALGCGDKNNNNNNGDDDDAGTGACPLLPDGADCQAGPECCSNICFENKCGPTADCDPAGAPCAAGATCCSGACIDDGSGNAVCGQGVGVCKPIGASCANAADCCSLGCSSGLCVDELCTVAGRRLHE